MLLGNNDSNVLLKYQYLVKGEQREVPKGLFLCVTYSNYSETEDVKG